MILLINITNKKGCMNKYLYFNLTIIYHKSKSFGIVFRFLGAISRIYFATNKPWNGEYLISLFNFAVVTLQEMKFFKYNSGI